MCSGQNLMNHIRKLRMLFHALAERLPRESLANSQHNCCVYTLLRFTHLALEAIDIANHSAVAAARTVHCCGEVLFQLFHGEIFQMSQFNEQGQKIHLVVKYTTHLKVINVETVPSAPTVAVYEENMNCAARIFREFDNSGTEIGESNVTRERFMEVASAKTKYSKMSMETGAI